MKGVWLCLAALLLAGCASSRPRPTEGAIFAASASERFAKDWSLDELLKVADPDFLKATPRAKLETMFANFRARIGPVTHFEDVDLESTQIGAKGQPIEVYSRQVTCQKLKGPATLYMTVQALDAKWTLLAFRLSVSRQDLQGQ